MSKRKNKRSMKLSSYNNNTSKKSFNHTMHRLYDILERDSFLEEQTQFLAKIISGNATAATSGNQIDSFFSFLNGVEQLSYKIRFIDKDSDYNTHEDPNDYVGTPKFPLLVSLHPDAIQETPSQNTHLPPDTIVILSDVDGDGIYKIEKILSEQEAGQFVLGTTFASATTQGAFKNNKTSFLGGLLDSSPNGKWGIGSNVVFRNTQEQEKAVQFLNQLSELAVKQDIRVFVNSAYRDATSQARVVAGNTFRTNGKNLVVYSAATKSIYLRLATKAHKNPTGPEMKELIEYEVKRLAANLKRNPDHQGHGTGYSFDLNITKVPQAKWGNYMQLIKSLGASVLHETNPQHYHINLRTWKPKELTIADKGYNAMAKLAKAFKEEE